MTVLLPQIKDSTLTREAYFSRVVENRDNDIAWQFEVRNALRNEAQLSAFFALSDDEKNAVRQSSAQGLPISVTPYYASLASATELDCPIRRQCVPLSAESQHVVGDLHDPLGEEQHEVAPHLVQRYPDRVLLLVTDRCSVYCRFCTRSRMVGQGGGVRAEDVLEKAFAYIESHPAIRDVIVSGGDALVMSDAKIHALLTRLSRIATVETVRIASRVPVTLPMRITSALCQVLRAHPSTWLMTHFNHDTELSPQAEHALRKLVDHGIPVLNQTVLLRSINDTSQQLARLFRHLVRLRVKPYYLLQMDPVRGTGHMRTSVARGMQIMDELQGNLSGIALPKYIVDTPGGMGKVHAQRSPLERYDNGVATFRTHRGVSVDYIDPPEPDRC